MSPRFCRCPCCSPPGQANPRHGPSGEPVGVGRGAIVHLRPEFAPSTSVRSPSTSRPRRTTSKHHQLVAATKVGLVSAALVLMVFAVVLLALAAWLP